MNIFRLTWLIIVILLSPQIVLAESREVNIAIVFDGDSPWSQQLREALNKELYSLGNNEFDFRFPPALQQDIQWNHDKAKAAIKRHLNNSKTDIVIAMGILSSSAAAELPPPQKPLIATTVLDAEQQGFPITEFGTSGSRNLHYIASNIDLLTELKRFQKATDASHVGILVDRNIASAIPIVSKIFEHIASQLDFNINLIEWSARDAQGLTEKLLANLDALFLLPQASLNKAQHRALIDMLINKKIPTFTPMGRSEVEAGILMGAGIIPAPKQLARQLAVDIRDIALGREAGDLRVDLQVKDRLSLNQKTAKAIGYEIPFAIFSEADIVSPLPENGQILTLVSAVEESLKHNLNIATAREEFDLAKQNTRIARSSLLPTISTNLNLDARDRDLVGNGATRSTSAGLSFSQSLYSESSHSQHMASKYYELAQKASLAQTRLDVIQQTLEAYLRLLIAKTELKVQRDNLKLTRANIERATFRYRVGSTDRSEVLRFETELNNGLQSVSNSQSIHQQAIHALNQILHRPIDATIKTREPNLSDQKIFDDTRLEAFISSPKKLEIFRGFLIKQSLENAPEINSLNSQIKAQKRLLLAAKRKRYIPDANLVGSVNRVLDDHGAKISTNPDEDWAIGIQFSLPLYQGDSISAEKDQANIELRRLQLLHKQIKDTIEAATRNSVTKAGASRRNIAYAKAAEKAAGKTLDMVIDSYVRGAASYIDLIDAQNSFLVSRLSSSNAIYQYLLDLSALQRAIGFFDFFITPEKRDAWFTAFDAYALTYREKNNEHSK